MCKEVKFALIFSFKHWFKYAREYVIDIGHQACQIFYVINQETKDVVYVLVFLLQKNYYAFVARQD